MGSLPGEGAEAKELSQQEAHNEAQQEQPCPQLGGRRHPCQVEAHLHPHVVDLLLDGVPSEVAEAWGKGKKVAGKRNPMRLIKHTRYRDERMYAMQELYDEGREWWEEACGGVEG